MYIQPCCIEKELPELLRKQPFAFFQSNGDWTTADLMKAVSCMVQNALCILSLPEVDVYLLRTLRTYLSKGWFRGLVLITAEPQAELVKSEMGGMLQLVTYVNNYQIQDGMFALTDFLNFIVIQGAMLTEKDFSLCLYSAYRGKDPNVFASAVESLTTKAKIGAFIKSQNEDIKSLLDKDYIK